MMMPDMKEARKQAEEFARMTDSEKDATIRAHPDRFSLCKSMIDLIPSDLRHVCEYYLKNFGGNTPSPYLPIGNITLPCNDVKCMLPHLYPTPPPPVVANITSCKPYDDYFCEDEPLAILKYNIMGSVALFFCIFGVLANTLFVPTFNVHAIRSSCTLYLSGIAVTDTIILILSTIIYIMQNLNPGYDSQLFFYKTFSAHMIPLGVPALELVQLLSLWFLVALLIDRFMFLKHGLSAKTMCSRSICAKVMLLMFVVLFAYTIPKCLKYKILEVPATQNDQGFVRLNFTELGKKEAFRNLMKNWLKVPVELFFPFLLLSGFGALLLFNTLNIQVNNAKRERARPENQNGAANGVPPKLHRVRSTPGAIAATAEQAALRKPKETAIMLENLNTQVVVGVTMLTLILKLPTFALHVLEVETSLSRDYINKFTVAVQFLNVLCASLRPLAYFSLGRHFRVAIRTMFCVCFIPGNKFVIFNTSSRSAEGMELKALEEATATTPLTSQQEQADVLRSLSDTDAAPVVVLDLCAADQWLSNINEEEEDDDGPITIHTLPATRRVPLSSPLSLRLEPMDSLAEEDGDGFRRPMAPKASKETLDDDESCGRSLDAERV